MGCGAEGRKYTMKKRVPTVDIPNRVITDAALSLSARKFCLYIYAHTSCWMTCMKSLEEWRELTGLSVNTIRRATAELVDAGYITVKQDWRINEENGSPMYGKKIYGYAAWSFNGDGVERNYTRIPRRMFRLKELTPSAFMTLAYLYLCAGNDTRAFPSINKIALTLGIAKSTVCLALQQIKKLPEVLVNFCKKQCRAFAANSYWLCNVVDALLIGNSDSTTAKANSENSMNEVSFVDVPQYKAEEKKKGMPGMLLHRASAIPKATINYLQGIFKGALRFFCIRG